MVDEIEVYNPSTPVSPFPPFVAVICVRYLKIAGRILKPRIPPYTLEIVETRQQVGELGLHAGSSSSRP